jgi:hypothetical protein
MLIFRTRLDQQHNQHPQQVQGNQRGHPGPAHKTRGPPGAGAARAPRLQHRQGRPGRAPEPGLRRGRHQQHFPLPARPVEEDQADAWLWRGARADPDRRHQP